MSHSEVLARPQIARCVAYHACSISVNNALNHGKDHNLVERGCQKGFLLDGMHLRISCNNHPNGGELWILWISVVECFSILHFFQTLTFVMVTNNEDMYKPTTTHFGFFVLGFVFMILEGYGPIACLMNPMISFSLFLAGRMSLARGSFLQISLNLM